MTSYDHDAVLNAALTALQTGNSAEAIRGAKLATEKRPDDAEGWSILGLAMGDHEGLSHLRKAADMEPQQPRWALHLGNGFSAIGDHENAQIALSRAAQLSRGHPHIMTVWGDCLFKLQRFREAANVFQSVLKSQPSTQVWVKAGDALMGANDTIHAAKAYERAHEPEQRPFEMSSKLADLHLLLNQYESADRFIQETLKTRPTDPDAGLRLANLHRWRGRHSEALQVQRDFWSNNQSHGGLIAALLDDGDYAVLDAALTVAKDTNRGILDRRRVNFSLARFYDRQKNEKAAWAHAVIANELYDDGIFYDGAAAHTKQLNQALSIFKTLPQPQNIHNKMIYVAGPPRCGGSLLQTILGRASGVTSVGERGALLSWILPKLDDASALSELLPHLGGPDLAGMEKAAGFADRYVDKTSPHIIILGLLAKIHGGAKFVIPARNAADMIVSMFFHDFPPEFAYTRSVQGIRDYLDFQKRAADAWRGAGLSIIDYDHDDFTQNPNKHGKALFGALDLTWSDSVLETGKSESVVRTFSARQVRGGISKKYAGRGERYSAFLRPDGK